jgi:hypothetical protein
MNLLLTHPWNAISSGGELGAVKEKRTTKNIVTFALNRRVPILAFTNHGFRSNGL